MRKQSTHFGLASLGLAFIGLPMLFYATGDFPRRTYLKESISIITIVAFCLMLAQLFLIRNSNIITSRYSSKSIIKIHKVIGYIFAAFLLIHPFLIVVPRYFESGVDSMDAFFTIITSFDNRGVVLGIVSWTLMLILAVTSFFRKTLPLTYRNWKIVHGMLSVLFISLASWHAIDLGRHINLLFSGYVTTLLMSGVFFWLKAT